MKFLSEKYFFVCGIYNLAPDSFCKTRDFIESMFNIKSNKTKTKWKESKNTLSSEERTQGLWTDETSILYNHQKYLT